MRTAETILNIIQDRGKRKLPLDDVYRQLYNPDMYLRAYTKLYKNDGAMTPGTTEETVDGMSFEKIDRDHRGNPIRTVEVAPSKARLHIQTKRMENDHSAYQTGHEKWFKK